MDTEHEDYEAECLSAWLFLTAAEREVLKCLFKHGPVWDGDVPSKTGRDGLLKKGLASRAIFQEQFGYTVATYKGGHVWKIGTGMTAK